MTETTFKKNCNKVSRRLLGFDCFDDGDPYDVEAATAAAIKSGQSPSAFVREVFHEDLAGKAYDKHLEREGRGNA